MSLHFSFHLEDIEYTLDVKSCVAGYAIKVESEDKKIFFYCDEEDIFDIAETFQEFIEDEMSS